MNRHIFFERLHNFRDLGGYTTRDGHTVRWGRLFRSDSLGKLRGQDWERFLDLGVSTVIDLRYPWEIDAKGRVPEHASLGYHNLSIEHRPYDQAALGLDVETGPFLAERYMEVAHDGARELRQALQSIAAQEGPVAFHCASGKDRTGLLAALVLALLGVPEKDIIEDFALTERAAGHLIADWRAEHPGQEPAWPGYGRAPADVMRLFLAALTAEHGSVRGYTTAVLGIDDALVATLRRNLLEPLHAPELFFRRATEADLSELVRLRDAAARRLIASGIDQWKPGVGEGHFRERIEQGEVWIADLGPGGPVAGAWELWWDDPETWGVQTVPAGYVHRLMTDRDTAPPGTGRKLLAEAESRIRTTGRTLCRLDCLADNARLRAYYTAAGYTVVGERPVKHGSRGGAFAVTLLEKRLQDIPGPIPGTYG